VLITVFLLDDKGASDFGLLDCLVHWKDVADAVLDGHVRDTEKDAWGWKNQWIWWSQEARDASEHETDESYETEDGLKPFIDGYDNWNWREKDAVEDRRFGHRVDEVIDRLGAIFGVVDDDDPECADSKSERGKQVKVITVLLAKTVAGTTSETELARRKARVLMKKYGITMKEIIKVVEGD